MNEDVARYSYEELECRIQAYLRREEGAAEVLLEAFRGFFIRWLQVMKGSASYGDRYHRIFVSMYVPYKGVRIQIQKGDKRGQPQFMYWLSIIRDRYAGMPRDEKWNELALCLLELANRYKPYDGYYQFHTYVMRSFPYYLHRRLEQYAGDISAFSQIIVPLEEDPEYESDHETATPFVVDDITLGEAWVSGATAGDGFSELTPLDRKIILHYYDEGLSDRQIAERIGLGRCAVNRRRIQAVAKLKNALEAGE